MHIPSRLRNLPRSENISSGTVASQTPETAFEHTSPAHGDLAFHTFDGRAPRKHVPLLEMYTCRHCPEQHHHLKQTRREIRPRQIASIAFETLMEHYPFSAEKPKWCVVTLIGKYPYLVSEVVTKEKMQGNELTSHSKASKIRVQIVDLKAQPFFRT